MKDGHSNTCKYCQNEYMKKYYIKNRKIIAQKREKYKRPTLDRESMDTLKPLLKENIYYWSKV